ncbi:uncharacterized protein LOC133730612 [Rosa rugosa]|uniref:uncharacterized protein LOC133730612 n=1 Tax=Rosa rugosa TaxID=74645 RepID=UPI002B40BF94|nr:uncharacterized protein LOC133730612 [Rosa rugosa]
MYKAGTIDAGALEETLQAISPSVTEEMNTSLCSQYTCEEVKEALFQMYPTKSPGPDGMPPLFFQHYWESIRDDITDLRPIALCNVIYKLCSKVIANRLKLILPQIISPFHSAFIPGRLITDNTWAANELAHFIHNKRAGEEYMALKLDLSKAYDRLEWGFLQKVMERMGFAHSWVKMIMQCVSSVRYSFLVRGKPRGYVVPSRGLRQGDPLSPYLFLLGAEGLSALLTKKADLGVLPGISICDGAPMVNHLLFADDSMLYANANLQACQEISNVLTVYGKASGQQVNFRKSSVTFSKNVDRETQNWLASFLGVTVVESHEKYLGLPTYVGRNKTSTFQYIQERLDQKLQAWQGRLLSGAGKDILIRRSISEARSVLVQGARWQVGDGNDIWIGDPWIPRDAPFRLLPVQRGRDAAWKVRNLLNNDGSWNETLVQQVCHVDDIPFILSIPLSSRRVKDRWVWHFDSNGRFSVKSAYKLLMEEEMVQEVSLQTQDLWTKLWSTNVPGTAKIFLWKVLNNCLPTIVRLLEKRVPLEIRPCVLCGVGDETIEHLCRLCPFVKGVLEAVPGIEHIAYSSSARQLQFMEWFWSCASNLPPNLWTTFVYNLWGIWTDRNNRVWDKKNMDVNQVVLLLSARLQEYQRHHGKGQGGGSRRVVPWKPPSAGWVKINGAFYKETCTGGIGVIIRDDMGRCLGGYYASVSHVSSSEQVEALAGREAVSLAIQRGLSPVIFETDSLTLFHATKQRVIPHTSFIGRVYDDITFHLQQMPGSYFTHAYRQANVVAHTLARFACSSSSSLFWGLEPPACIVDVLSKEFTS